MVWNFSKTVLGISAFKKIKGVKKGKSDIFYNI